MFSQVCVKNSVYREWDVHDRGGGLHGRGGACMVGGHAWWGCVTGGMHGRGCVWWGGCAWQGACVAGGCVWQERRPLQRMVRILLECILVISFI